MAFRDDVEALTARHQTLEAELAAKTREVAEAARILDEARARRTLPVLPNLRVASPCPADWAKMTGDDRVRACGDCKKNVYNLSEMTRDEAEALILEKEGRLCVRYFQRTDGTILLKDCVIGVQKKRRRRIVAVGAAAMLAGTGIAARFLAADAPAGKVVGNVVAPMPLEPDTHIEEVKGEISPTRGDYVLGEWK